MVISLLRRSFRLVNLLPILKGEAFSCRSEGDYVMASRIFMFVWVLVGWYFAMLKPGLIFDVTSITVAGV